MVQISNIIILTSILVFCSTTNAQKQTPTNGGSNIMGRRVTKTLKILSPLQSLTFFPKETTDTTTTPRDEFLPKFQAGLTAETKIKSQLARRREFSADDISPSGPGWEKQMEEKERLRAEKEDEIVDKAWDRATARFQEKSALSVASPSAAAASSDGNSEYQFVGVIQPPNSEKKVKWYARKRPNDSKWNIRMIHVNKDAIIRDMFTSGKVDIMGKYVNTGEQLDEVKEGEVPSLRPRIKGEYSVKPRSILNLWNFSPKHFFTDSSGAFWRERRLSPGLYTDGKLVYESSYRYTDGKNGMKPISKLDALLKSKSIKNNIKSELLNRLQNDAPDVVIEE